MFVLGFLILLTSLRPSSCLCGESLDAITCVDDFIATVTQLNCYVVQVRV